MKSKLLTCLKIFFLLIIIEVGIHIIFVEHPTVNKGENSIDAQNKYKLGFELATPYEEVWPQGTSPEFIWFESVRGTYNLRAKKFGFDKQEPIFF